MPVGDLFHVNWETGVMYRIDPVTGEYEEVGGAEFGELESLESVDKESDTYTFAGDFGKITGTIIDPWASIRMFSFRDRVKYFGLWTAIKSLFRRVK